MSETRKGKFIVIEGTDGSGKAEQTKRLIARLAAAGFSVEELDFPQYGKPSAYFVERYLRGEYGPAAATGPKKASLFYALDRFDIGEKIVAALNRGAVVVSNRYVASNLGHQGAKISDDRERAEFFRWDYELEYGILGIPKPDLNVVLRVSAETAYELVAKKGERAHLFGEKRDIHEADIEHLRMAERVYLEIVAVFPGEFTLIECVARGVLLPREAIQEKVWRAVQPLLGL